MRKTVAMLVAAVLFCSTIFASAGVAYAATYVSLVVSGATVPSTLGPGESGNLVLTVSNTGTAYARNVKLFVKPQASVAFTQQSYDLQTIAPSGSVQVSVPVKIASTATEGATSVFLSLTYNEGDTVGAVTIETSVPLAISKRSLVQIESVSWGKDMVQPGDVVEATLLVRNAGNSDLSYMTVTLDDSSQPFVAAAGATEAYVGSLPTSVAKEAKFSIIVNRDAKTVAYRIPVSIGYYDESGTLHTDTKYIGLKVSGRPDFVVTLEDDSRAYAGAEGELTISIANRGTATANFLTLKFDSGLEITPAEYYIGNLDPDDYQTVKVNAEFAGLAAGMHKLSMYMEYKDPYNVELSRNASVDFRLRNLPAGSISPLMLVVLAVIAAALFWKRKRIIELVRRK